MVVIVRIQEDFIFSKYKISSTFTHPSFFVYYGYNLFGFGKEWFKKKESKKQNTKDNYYPEEN
jgi:hypothetical protein